MSPPPTREPNAESTWSRPLRECRPQARGCGRGAPAPGAGGLQSSTATVTLQRTTCQQRLFEVAGRYSTPQNPGCAGNLSAAASGAPRLPAARAEPAEGGGSAGGTRLGDCLAPRPKPRRSGSGSSSEPRAELGPRRPRRSARWSLWAESRQEAPGGPWGRSLGRSLVTHLVTSHRKSAPRPPSGPPQGPCTSRTREQGANATSTTPAA